MKLGPIMILAVVVAVFGAAAVFTAQHFLQSQSRQSNRAHQAVASQVEMKTVVVAVRPLRFGAELTPEHLREVEWPASATPIGAFNSISELLTDEGRRVVVSPIEANEPVLSWKVTGPGERATLSVVVEDGMRAMSVRIRDTNGIAGFLLPGDPVDVMLTRDHYPDILLQNVRILAIDQTADERLDRPKTATATLEVNTVDVQKLSEAQAVGSLSLALRANPTGLGDFPNPGTCDFPYGTCREWPQATQEPRRITMSDRSPAYEIYADAKDEKTEEEKADELLAKNVESGFQAMESRIEKMGEDFTRKIQPMETDAMAFDPNARVGIIRGMAREEYRIPKLTSPGERTTLSAVVEDGMRAISVRINDVLGVAGFVLPGDRVDIMLTRDGYTDILLQNVKILAMDQPADERLGKPKTGKTATVEVNSVDAQKLTLAETAGSLSLALRAAGSVPAAAPRRIKLKDIGPAYEVWINEMGREFNRHAPETLPFYPYTRCAGLYATLCYDGDGTLIR